MKEFKELFSVIYTEHNGDVKDGAHKQEPLYMENEQANAISASFSFIYAKVDRNKDYGA